MELRVIGMPGKDSTAKLELPQNTFIFFKNEVYLFILFMCTGV